MTVGNSRVGNPQLGNSECGIPSQSRNHVGDSRRYAITQTDIPPMHRPLILENRHSWGHSQRSNSGELSALYIRSTYTPSWRGAQTPGQFYLYKFIIITSNRELKFVRQMNGTDHSLFKITIPTFSWRD
jgi:hypothetical protein